MPRRQSCVVAAALRVAALLILGLHGAASQATNPCWSADFSVASCCLHPGQGDACWSGEYDYEKCCLQSPPLAAAEVAAFNALTDDDLACGCGSDVPSVPVVPQGEFEWCQFRRAVMLNWDLRPFYLPFTGTSVAKLAACPTGAITMLLFDSYLKLSSQAHDPDLRKSPAFRWAEAAFSVLVKAERVTMAGLAASGWMPFFQMSSLRLALSRRGGSLGLSNEDLRDCAGSPVNEDENRAMLLLEEFIVQQVPLSMEAALRISGSTGTCGVAKAAISFATAYSLQKRVLFPDTAPQLLAERQRLLAQGEAQLRRVLEGSARPISVLIAVPWPLLEQTDLMCHNGLAHMSLILPLQKALELPEDHALLRKFEDIGAATGKPPAYYFRIFPHREMISDMIRFSGLPFCGLRPFMRMVVSVAAEALAAGCPHAVDGSTSAEKGSPCAFTFVEGGPHLGDCTLWAATTLRLAGVHVQALAFEPLPDASAFFRQGVVENDLAGSVKVRSAAMGRSSDKKVEMVYYWGHNGQASVLASDSPVAKPEEMTIVPNIPVAVLDEEVPPSWPLVDVVKLSVNGGERDTVEGARKLLSKRRICSVMLHTMKANRGRAPTNEGGAKYSADLLSALHDGGMEVWTHRDSAARGGPLERVKSSTDLDRAFDMPDLAQQDYIIARSTAPACALAQRHWAEAAGGPLP